MLKLLFLVITIIVIGGCNSPNHHSISGRVKNLEQPTILLLEDISVQPFEVLDTLKLDKNGSFKSGYNFKSLGFYRLRTKDYRFVNFIMQPGAKESIEIEHLDSLKLSDFSSPLNDTMELFNHVFHVKEQKDKAIKERYEFAKSKHLESIAFEKLNHLYTINSIRFKKELKSLIQEVNSDYALLYGLGAFPFDEETELFDQKLKQLSDRYPDNQAILDMMENFEMQTAFLGESFPTLKGQYIKFNKPVTIVEFWASWATPYIQRIYEQRDIITRYDNKDLDVYSINLDIKPELWKNTINKAPLPYIHLNDSLGFQFSDDIKNLKIKQLPANFIVNEKGIVVAKNKWGRNLENILIDQLGY